MTKPLIGLVLVLLATTRGGALAQPPTNLEDYTVFGEQKVVFGTFVRTYDGAVGSNGVVKIGGLEARTRPVSAVVADSLRLGRLSRVDGNAYFNTLYLGTDAQVASPHPGITLPILTLPPPVPVLGTGNDVRVEDGESLTLAPGAYGSVDVRGGGRLVLQPGTYEMYGLELRPRMSSLFCEDEDNGGECLVRVRSKLRLRAQHIGYRTPSTPGFGRIVVEFAGTNGVTVGGADWGARIKMTLRAPLAKINLKTRDINDLFFGRFAGRQVKVGNGARISAGLSCGDGVVGDGDGQYVFEQCDGTNASLCPGLCRSDCVCEMS